MVLLVSIKAWVKTMKLEKKKRCTETKEFVLVSHLFKFLKELEFQELEFHFSILRRTQIFKI